MTIRPKGKSMKGRVEDGQEVLVRPVVPATLKPGDVVLCRVKGSDYLHLVKEISWDGMFLIGNNKGGINGWIRASAIYGRADV